MSGFEATNDAGERIDDLTPDRLDQLLSTWTDITIVNPDWGGRHGARAQRDAGSERWEIRIRAGERVLATTTPGRAATYDALRSWAAADGWWQEAFTWSEDIQGTDQAETGR